MKINKIKKNYFEGKVYNFHCLPDENYFTENVLVHNCYKGNGSTNKIEYMPLETYKKLLDKFPKTLTQVALGITDFYANPDMIEILKYTRELGIIPNYTTNGLDIDEKAIQATKDYCGAVSVSVICDGKRKKYYRRKKQNITQTETPPLL